MCQILRAYSLEGSDFEFRLQRAYPERELITQWRETNLQFIQRILAEDGIWFRTGMNTTTGLGTVTFADIGLEKPEDRTLYALCYLEGRKDILNSEVLREQLSNIVRGNQSFSGLVIKICA